MRGEGRGTVSMDIKSGPWAPGTPSRPPLITPMLNWGTAEETSLPQAGLRGDLNHVKSYLTWEERAPVRSATTEARKARSQPPTCPSTATQGRRPSHLREAPGSEGLATRVRTSPRNIPARPKLQSWAAPQAPFGARSMQSGRLRKAGRSGPAGKARRWGCAGLWLLASPQEAGCGQSGRKADRPGFQGPIQTHSCSSAPGRDPEPQHSRTGSADPKTHGRWGLRRQAKCTLEQLSTSSGPDTALCAEATRFSGESQTRSLNLCPNTCLRTITRGLSLHDFKEC